MNCECQNLHLPFWVTHLFWKAGDVWKLITLTHSREVPAYRSSYQGAPFFTHLMWRPVTGLIFFTPSLLPPQSNLLHSCHYHSSAHLPCCPASRIKHSLSKPAKVFESVFALLNDIYTANFSVDRTGPVTEWTIPRLMYALKNFYFVAHRSLIDG